MCELSHLCPEAGYPDTRPTVEVASKTQQTQTAETLRKVDIHLISFHFLPKSEKWNPFEIDITYMPVDVLIKKTKVRIEVE